MLEVVGHDNKGKLYFAKNYKIKGKNFWFSSKLTI